MMKFLKEKILDKTTIDDKIVGGVKKIKKEVRKHIITAIMAALGFTIALFWRDAIQATITGVLDKFDVTQNTFYYKILVAVIVTIICVVAIIVFAKFEEKEIKA